MKNIWAEQVLTAQGWASSVCIEIGVDGRIEKITREAAPEGDCVGIVLPAPANLHSHSFQRAMAGMTESRGPNPRDTFWTWRELMYRFLDHLSPDDIGVIAAFVQMEMLEAGFACVAEFHYLHHQPDGTPYDDLAELANHIVAAAATTGIGLTLLPVLYEHGGCDGRPLGLGQVRFGNDTERFARLHKAAAMAVARLPNDSRMGVAAHSLRAVSHEGLSACVKIAPEAPIHIHIAEQTGEVDEVKAAWGKRPVEWLFAHHEVNKHWCLIHATQMETHETEIVARSGAVTGLCPITESSLGDGIFDGVHYLRNNGRFGIGSDSNIRISLSEELRTFEYSQRLRDRGRAILATENTSTGRALIQSAAKGGAQAVGRDSGEIEVGRFADLVALDSGATDLLGKEGDAALDSYVFAGDDNMITDVWSAGRHLVTGGRHVSREAITARYHDTIRSLKARI